MFNAAKAQRSKQVGSYALRSLEQNPRFVHARHALVMLGEVATEVVITECMQHR